MDTKELNGTKMHAPRPTTHDATLRLRIPGDLFDLAKLAADMEGKSLSAFTRDALRSRIKAEWFEGARA